MYLDSLTLTQSAEYGKCIVADYNNVYKDKCMTEFMRLKDCYVVRIRSPVVLSSELTGRRLTTRSSNSRMADTFGTQSIQYIRQLQQCILG